MACQMDDRLAARQKRERPRRVGVRFCDACKETSGLTGLAVQAIGQADTRITERLRGLLGGGT